MVLHERNNIFFWRTPKISRTNDFYRTILGEYWEIKIKKDTVRTLYILKLLYAGSSTEEAISFFPFLEHLKLQKTNYFGTCPFGRSRQIKMKTLVSGH